MYHFSQKKKKTTEKLNIPKKARAQKQTLSMNKQKKMEAIILFLKPRVQEMKRTTNGTVT